MAKTRLAKDGTRIEAPKGKELKGDLERIAATKAEGGNSSRISSPVDLRLTLPLHSLFVVLWWNSAE